uniref:Uncharacterized protein n=1 Tax=Rhizophagus irregularis (strain DAOM 181602 / DAOM 197198 / MUCL 43194) TaxID=747089 RepID=U9SZQ8_RHIID
MPVAISIQELRESIIERLKAKHDEEKFSTISVPSSEWIRLQFWPKNIYTGISAGLVQVFFCFIICLARVASLTDLPWPFDS